MGQVQEFQLSLMVEAETFVPELNIFKGRLREEDCTIKKIKHYNKQEVDILRAGRGKNHIICFYTYLAREDADNACGYLVYEPYPYTLYSFVMKPENHNKFVDNGKLTDFSRKLIRGMVLSLWDIKQLHIIHGNLTPWSFAIIGGKDKGWTVKFCDFTRSVAIEDYKGDTLPIPKDKHICLRRKDDEILHQWQTPEQFHQLEKTGYFTEQYFTLDIFNLGCLVGFIFLKKHLFGDGLTAKNRMMLNNVDLSELPEDPELRHLIKDMVHSNPTARLTIFEVILHPFFWSSARALLFLCLVSDFLQNRIMVYSYNGLSDFEAYKEEVVGQNQSWQNKIDKLFTSSFALKGQMMKGNNEFTDSLTDLVRYIRNICSHLESWNGKLWARHAYARKLAKHLKQQFPKLFLALYKYTKEMRCPNDQFEEYYSLNNQSTLETVL